MNADNYCRTWTILFNKSSNKLLIHGRVLDIDSYLLFRYNITGMEIEDISQFGYFGKDIYLHRFYVWADEIAYQDKIRHRVRKFIKDYYEKGHI